jgi:hypothetical protein
VVVVVVITVIVVIPHDFGPRLAQQAHQGLPTHTALADFPGQKPAPAPITLRAVLIQFRLDRLHAVPQRARDPLVFSVHGFGFGLQCFDTGQGLFVGSRHVVTYFPG